MKSSFLDSLAVVLLGALCGFFVGEAICNQIASATPPSVSAPISAPAVVPEELGPAPAPPAPEENAQADEWEWEKGVRQDRVLAYSGGLFLEALANATPADTLLSAFAKNFMKQAGVQIQVAVMEDANLVSRNPAVAFAQGFLVGL